MVEIATICYCEWIHVEFSPLHYFCSGENKNTSVCEQLLSRIDVWFSSSASVFLCSKKSCLSFMSTFFAWVDLVLSIILNATRCYRETVIPDMLVVFLRSIESMNWFFRTHWPAWLVITGHCLTHQIFQNRRKLLPPMLRGEFSVPLITPCKENKSKWHSLIRSHPISSAMRAFEGRRLHPFWNRKSCQILSFLV